MPLEVIIGSPPSRRPFTLPFELLFGAGAKEVGVIHRDTSNKDFYAVGMFVGIFDPNGSKADQLIDLIHSEMSKPKYSKLWIEEVRGIRRKR